MKRKGFTLIELLAVIIILGILMLIAIPSVTSYINDSRKKTYVSTINEIVKAAAIKVNSGELNISDTDTTYYIPTSSIKLENGDAKSPYGEFEEAYVVVTYDGEEYDYYFVGKDSANMGIAVPKAIDKLDKDEIKEVDDVIPSNIGIGNRKNVTVLNDDGTIKESSPSGMKIDGETGEEVLSAVFPEGKNKQNVEIGEIVKIGTEEFFVIDRHNNDLVLIGRYNLNVGNWPYPEDRVGVQSQYAVGYASNEYHYGMLSFSSTKYWDGQVGEGKKYKCVDFNWREYVYNNCDVFDENSELYSYIMDYKNILQNEFGQYIKEVRLLKGEEYYKLYYGGYYNTVLKGKRFWTSRAHVDDIMIVTGDDSNNYYGDYDNMYFTGVCPVIVI